MSQDVNVERKKILLVDDEKDILLTVSYQLKGAGYDVITAEDGEDALRKAQTEFPDLIIMDLMLPKIEGDKVCGLLKRNVRFANIPIILFTARVHEEDKTLCEETGANAYITKPFESSDLIKKISQLLGVEEG